MANLPKINNCRLARKMLREGQSMDDVIAALENKFTASEIERGIAAFRIREQGYHARARVGASKRMSGLGEVRVAKVDVPPEVLADRERRSKLKPCSLVAATQGDPPLELSALVRRSERYIPRDPLQFLTSPFDRHHSATAH